MEACIIDPYDLPTSLTPGRKRGSYYNSNNEALLLKKNFILVGNRIYNRHF